MNSSIQRRLDALEGPREGPCASCELLVLNRAAAAETDDPLPPCTHWPPRTLAEELHELNTIERMTP